jgi:hypothetical protein
MGTARWGQLHNEFRTLAKVELQGAMSAHKHRYGPTRKALQKSLDDGNAPTVRSHPFGSLQRE